MLDTIFDVVCNVCERLMLSALILLIMTFLPMAWGVMLYCDGSFVALSLVFCMHLCAGMSSRVSVTLARASLWRAGTLGQLPRSGSAAPRSVISRIWQPWRGICADLARGMMLQSWTTRGKSRASLKAGTRPRYSLIRHL